MTRDWFSSRKKLFAAFVFVASFAGASTSAEPAPAPAAPQTRNAKLEIPKTPAGTQFSAWLAAFNAGDRARLEVVVGRFAKPDARRLEAMLDFHRRTGGFDLKKIEESTETKLTGLVQERDSDQIARFEMQLDPAEPHKIVAFGLRTISRPAEFALPRMSQADLLTALRAELEKATAADHFSGAVLLAKNGKAVFTGAYGFADRDKKVPNTLDTKFRIGSMNKMFTAVATLQLVQAGKLSLDETVGKFIPDYPNKQIATEVTIRQLLTHTGGTGDFFGPQFDAHRLELKTLDDYVKLYGARAPEFQPGSRWEYSNYGFLLLGVIIERVSGQNYYDYVQQHVYMLAGMTSTGSDPEDQQVPKRSVGYTQMEGPQLRPNTDTLPYRGTSAGGGYSTVEDFLRFANALHDHKLLNAQYTEMLTTGKVDTPGGTKYAFGFMEADAGQPTHHFGHGGGAPGMNGDLEIYPEAGYVIVVLSNLDPQAAGRVSDFIANRMPLN